MAQRRVFISYSRKDGEAPARGLQRDLEAAGFEVWLDVERIRGGASWSKSIEDGLAWCGALVAVLTPASYASEMCRSEQIWALEAGRCVIPVIAAVGVERPFYFASRQYRRYPEEFAELLEDFGLPPAPFALPAVRYDTVPNLPQNFLPRADLLARLRDLLFTEGDGANVAVTALEGMGGIGKTVLATALCRDPAVRRAFPDGIAWITVGRETTTDWLTRMREVARALGDDVAQYDSDLACENRYRTILREKAALVVIDDVWDVGELERLLVESPRSRFVFTTRESGIAGAVAAREFSADLLTEKEARDLLARWAGPLAAEADAIIAECGRLALAIAVIGASLRGASVDEWRDTLDSLKRADVSTIEERLPKGRKSFFRSLEVSLQGLTPQMRERYLALAVLLEDLPAALPVLQTLWRVSAAETRRTARYFVDRSLASWDTPEHAALRLHDLQLDYARAKSADCDTLPLIHGAIRLSSHVILRDPLQFASQLVGRLLPYQDVAAIEQFAHRITEGAPKPWLRPLWPSLDPSGTPLIRTLEGHSARVHGVAVSSDGRRVVSASWDHTLKVWDLETGRALRTLEGYSSIVSGAAVSPDGRRAISASWDCTLKVWDLETGRALRTLEGHWFPVNCVALSPDGRRAVSASWDRTLKVWDLETGRTLRTLEGHTLAVSAVALSPDGRRAVSASWDRTLRMWDLETGRILCTLEGHSAWVYGVAVSADGRRAVSVSGDRTLKVWDLETGCALRTLEGHSAEVDGVAVSADGRRAVSASLDRTLKVWDLETGRALLTLEGHSDIVRGVAVSADWRCTVSASWDRTLKVWDLETGGALRTLKGHSHSVNGVAVSADGRRAVSASVDQTLKVWDLETGRAVHTKEGRSARVFPVAVGPDGRWVVSGSLDNTLRVWDLESGYAFCWLRGHCAWVNGVALSADGRRAVSVSDDDTLKVWDLETGRALRTLQVHSGVNGVAVSANGQRAISASRDSTVKVWDLQTEHEPLTLEGHSSINGLALSADGRRAVCAFGDKTLRMWELDTGSEPLILEAHSDDVNGVAVSADGRRAASASSDNTLKVWDLETGALRATFTCDAAAMCCVFIDDHTLMAGDVSGRVYFLALEGA